MMNKTTITLILLILMGCDGLYLPQNNNKSPIFPSLLEDQSCFLDNNTEGSSYFRHTLKFDTHGYRSFGKAHYEESDCITLKNRTEEELSSYPYTIGGKTTNSDGSEGMKLYFPNPENSTSYGSVYRIIDDELCFAENTLTFTQNNITFSPTSTDGDFSGLKIDTINCLIIIDS
jgi:hypothetical protein